MKTCKSCTNKCLSDSNSFQANAAHHHHQYKQKKGAAIASPSYLLMIYIFYITSL